MGSVLFEPWPKIARLNRDIIVTEKIDGTNAAVVIVPLADLDYIEFEHNDEGTLLFSDDAKNVTYFDGEYAVFAQSRKRFIQPGNDNFGFAAWVRDNAPALIELLGPGRHFGEWWGYGIQSGYGLPKGDRRFSLFNTSRWTEENIGGMVEGLGVVPNLYRGVFSEHAIRLTLDWLENYGSQAAQGFMHPEGIVVYHTAANTTFKVTLKNDDAPKGPEGHKGDEEMSG